MQTEKVGFDAKNEMRQISLEKQLFGDSSLEAVKVEMRKIHDLVRGKNFVFLRSCFTMLRSITNASFSQCFQQFKLAMTVRN